MEDIPISLPGKLGKFDLERELGHGSMAIVYLGHDPFMNRDVAVKVALPKLIQDKKNAAQFKKMFFNEARIAGMLDHKHILPVYDAGMEDNLLYIVMECIKGATTLKDFCDQDKLLPIPKALEVMFKCCKALDYAHSRDVIHRDLKPSNILVTDELDVRIADFGIAQVMRAEETQMMGLIGSPRYMSPEQISEQTLTNQSDLFSIGVVMYELLTGRQPFMANNLASLANEIMTKEPPLMKTFRPDVPDSLEMIVKRAMAKNPTARYPRGNDFAADLALAYKNQQHLAMATDTTKQEKFKRLKSNRFFKDFFDSEIMEVIDAGEWCEYNSGQVIVSEGDLDDSFFILVNGTVEVKKGGVTLSLLKESDCFGEMAYFTKSKRTATIVAATNVILFKINSSRIEKASTNCQLRFTRVFLYTLIERLSKTSEKAASAKQ